MHCAMDQVAGRNERLTDTNGIASQIVIPTRQTCVDSNMVPVSVVLSMLVTHASVQAAAYPALRGTKLTKSGKVLTGRSVLN